MLGTDFEQWRWDDRAGIVDDDIECTELRSNPVGNAADIVVAADIEQACLNIGPCFTCESRGVIKRMLINMADQKQVRSFKCKCKCDAASDAAAGPGNESNLSFECSHRTSCRIHRYTTAATSGCFFGFTMRPKRTSSRCSRSRTL